VSTFRLPDLGEGLHEAEITAWHVAPGDRVKAGDTLVAVETDKAVVEIPSPESGVVQRCHGQVGDHVAVGDPLVEIGPDAPGEAAPALVGRLPGEAPRQPAPPRPAAPPLPPGGGAPAIKASPAVRAEARRLGIDLAAVPGSGPAGVVTLADLGRAAAATSRVLAEPLRGPRRAMARNMARAQAEVAAATVTDEAVVAHWTAATDVTGELIAAVVAGCRAAPALNAWFDGPSLTRTLHDAVDLGIAMDTEGGLFVPVLRRAGSLDAASRRAELDRLKAAVADHSVAQADLARPTLTLSNFGTLGGRHAALMLLPPQVAILGAGRTRKAVVPVKGKPAIRRVLPLSLTFDHRAVTGGEAARFLAAVIETLEQGGTARGATPDA
jgi:pyruvate dehydrogenase E2 component (dihydrolipoamide acetyltransferase)